MVEKPKRRWLLGLVMALALTQVCVFGLAGCGNEEQNPSATQTSQEAKTRVVEDDLGRQVEIPGVAQLQKIYYTTPIAQIYCNSLAPELCCGTNLHWSDAEKQYLPKELADLPFLGTWGGGQELNPEEIKASGAQILFYIPPYAPKPAMAEKADKLSKQLDIPVLVYDGCLGNEEACFKHLGEVLGKEDRAKELGSYCTKVVSDVEAAVANIPESERVRLYYAEGAAGLETEPVDSSHAAVFKIAGAVNVADVEKKGGTGRSPVNLEQVIAWDPDVIIAWGASKGKEGICDFIREDPQWQGIKAVKDKNVYMMPYAPYSWCDRPPSCNRIIGIQWVANLLYPKYYDVDMVKETKTFYKMFYGCELSDAQAQELLSATNPEKFQK